MNKNFLVFIFTTLLSLSLFGEERQLFKYSNHSCKQKDIPFTVTKSENGNSVGLKLTTLKEVESLSLQNVRGLDGLSVLEFTTVNKSVVKKGEHSDITVKLSPFSGLVYLVLDIKYKVHGVVKSRSLTLPMGTISKDQKEKRAKDITSFSRKLQTLPGNRTILKSTTDEKVHVMKLN